MLEVLTAAFETANERYREVIQDLEAGRGPILPAWMIYKLRREVDVTFSRLISYKFEQGLDLFDGTMPFVPRSQRPSAIALYARKK